jgi:hypothetical protein
VYFSWFTPAGGWTAPQALATTGDTFVDVAVSMNDQGRAIVVWGEWMTTGPSTGSRDVFASRYDPALRVNGASGWGPRVLIESSGENAFYPKVAMNSAGDVLVAWQSFEYGVSRYTVWGTSYSRRLARWESAVRLETGEGSVNGSDGNPVVTIDAQGNGAALWVQQDELRSGSPNSVWANRFENGRWSANAVTVESGNGHATWPRLAVSSRGTTMAVWSQTEIVTVNGFPRGVPRVFCSFWNPGSGRWNPPVRLSDEEGAFLVGVEMDGVGGGIVAWTGVPAGRLWHRRYSNDAWGPIEASEVGVESRVGADLAVSANGTQAQAIFRTRTSDATGHVTEQIASSRFRTSVRRVLRQGSAGYTGASDAWIDATSPTTGRGSAATLKLDGSPDAAAVLRWDLSDVPAESTLSSAELRLTVTDTSSASFDVREVKRPWSEGQVTWRRYGRSSDGRDLLWQLAGAAGPADVADGALAVLRPKKLGANTTTLGGQGLSLVQGWITNPASNRGLIVQNYADTAGDAASFASREGDNVANRPALILTYVVP